jgi:uncharacterized SAM-binding protein YcdF (DUF218 family)
MEYIVSKCLGVVAQPSTLLLLFCLAGISVLQWRAHSSWGWRLLLIGVGGLAACAIFPVGTWLMRPLEDRFSQPHPMPERVDGIVLLGGAIDLRVSADRGMLTLNARAERMTDFVALARRYPHAQLVFSGGGDPRRVSTDSTEADVARSAFSRLGIDPSRIIFEKASRSTHENATLSRSLVNLTPEQHWLLVTSAADMPRAVGCFRAVHWSVIPFPVDYHTKQQTIGMFPGLVGGLQRVDWATHEWLGLAYYRIRGWIPSLFPAPH